MPDNYTSDINFSQLTYLYLLSKDKLVHIAEKFILHGNKELLKDIQGSVGVGLSSYYMGNIRQGESQQGENFLVGLKQLIYTIEMPISASSSTIVKAKLMAEKVHAKEKLNRILTVIIDIQKRHSNYIDINNYVPDPYMWFDVLPDETAHHYIDRVKSNALELNTNLKNSSWFAEIYIDLKSYYYSKDVVSIENIKTSFNQVLLEKNMITMLPVLNLIWIMECNQLYLTKKMIVIIY